MGVLVNCGHKTTVKELSKGNILIKSHAKDGKPCLISMLVCPRCKECYRKKRLTVKGKRFIDRWMKEGR